MALLKFRCKACGKVFDELVSPAALKVTVAIACPSPFCKIKKIPYT